MTSTSTTVRIDAPPERVWQLLTDRDWWNTADNGVVELTGTIAPGEKITVVSELQPKRGFALKVTEMQAPRQMLWTGGMPMGLFTGRRSYTINPTGEAACTFTMREDFSGLMAPLITSSLPDFQPNFDTFAAALKADAEA